VDQIASDAEHEFGGLDILVHCAGTIDHGAIANSAPQMLDVQFRSNVRLPYVVTHRLLPLLRKRTGHVVFLNSSIVSGPPRPNMSQFAASQHALRAFAETLRLEVNPHGIRVLCVYPGRTATSRQARLYEKEGRPYEADLLLQPEDIATMIVAALALPRTAEVTEIGIRPMLKSY
jgi:NADP-dependent 3-hydroxy acid dehydrogenase YdfG